MQRDVSGGRVVEPDEDDRAGRGEREASFVGELARISERIIAGDDLDSTLQGILETLREALGAERSSIMLKTTPDKLRIRAARGLADDVVRDTTVPVGEGISGEVAERGAARLLRNAAALGQRDGGTSYTVNSAICVPLRYRGDVIGVINLSNKRDAHGIPCEFDERDLRVAALLANQAALAIAQAVAVETARQHERLEGRLEALRSQVGSLEPQAAALEVIHQVTDSLISAGSLDEVLSGIVTSTTALLGARRGSLMLIEPGGRLMRMHAAVGIPEKVVRKARTELGQGIAGRCARSGEAVLLRDAREALHRARGDDGGHPDYRNQSAICVPLSVRSEILGVLNINDPADGKDFTRNDLFVARIIANQAAVAIRNSRLLDQSVEAAETRRSIDVARAIQQSFLPRDAELADVTVASRSIACDGAGGDYVDYWPRAEGAGDPGAELVLAIGDVSGHGVGAALIMATVRASLRALMSHSDDPSEVLHQLNRLVVQDVRRGQFVTLFLGVLDAGRRRLRYASAGHDPPLGYGPRMGGVRELGATGPPLGVLDDTEYPTLEVDLDRDEILALTTDGVWEVKNGQGDCFGRERVVEALRDFASADPGTIVAGIQRRVAAFAHPVRLADDFSLVVVKLGGGADGSRPEAVR